MKICKDGRIWGQNNREAGNHLGILTGEKKQEYKRKGYNMNSAFPKGIGQRGMLGKHHSKKTRQKMLESRIKYMTSGKIKRKDTSIEIAIERELIKQHIPYMKQVPLEGITVVDFLLPNRIVIYCDGNYWHNKLNIKNRDLNQDFILTFKGYKVFRFWEKDIKKSAKRCIKKILKERDSD